MMETGNSAHIDADRLRAAFPDGLCRSRCFAAGLAWIMPVGRMYVELEKSPAGSVAALEMTQKGAGLSLTLTEIFLFDDQQSVARQADWRKRRYRVGEVHRVYDDLLGRLLVDRKGNA